MAILLWTSETFCTLPAEHRHATLRWMIFFLNGRIDFILLILEWTIDECFPRQHDSPRSSVRQEGQRNVVFWRLFQVRNSMVSQLLGILNRSAFIFRWKTSQLQTNSRIVILQIHGEFTVRSSRTGIYRILQRKGRHYRDRLCPDSAEVTDSRDNRANYPIETRPETYYRWIYWNHLIKYHPPRFPDTPIWTLLVMKRLWRDCSDAFQKLAASHSNNSKDSVSSLITWTTLPSQWGCSHSQTSPSLKVCPLLQYSTPTVRNRSCRVLSIHSRKIDSEPQTIASIHKILLWSWPKTPNTATLYRNIDERRIKSVMKVSSRGEHAGLIQASFNGDATTSRTSIRKERRHRFNSRATPSASDRQCVSGREKYPPCISLCSAG